MEAINEIEIRNTFEDIGELETLDEVVARTKLPKSWWYQNLRSGTVEGAYKIQKYWRFNRPELNRWLMRQAGRNV